MASLTSSRSDVLSVGSVPDDDLLTWSTVEPADEDASHGELSAGFA
jgi:hypothetical protein